MAIKNSYDGLSIEQLEEKKNEINSKIKGIRELSKDYQFKVYEENGLEGEENPLLKSLLRERNKIYREITKKKTILKDRK